MVHSERLPEWVARNLDLFPYTALIDVFAMGIDPAKKAAKFLNLNRWTGDDPVLLLADAAGTTTGQNYFKHVQPSVEEFREAFLATDRVTSFASLAELDPDTDDLRRIFGAKRKRRVLIEGADDLATMPGDTDLDRLQTWADAYATPQNYADCPFGRIDGVGLRTFQFLRMTAGIDTVKPDIQVTKFIEDLSGAKHGSELAADSDWALLQSCTQIAEQTDYSLLELDQIAWWHYSDAGEQHVRVRN